MEKITAIILTVGSFTDSNDITWEFDIDLLIDLVAGTNQVMKKGMQIPVFIDGTEFVGEVTAIYLSFNAKAIICEIVAEPVDEQLNPGVSIVNVNRDNGLKYIQQIRMGKNSLITTARRLPDPILNGFVGVAARQ